MKKLRIDLKIRNNVLYQLIFTNYKSVSDFCKSHGLHGSVVGDMLNLKKSSVFRSNGGEYKKCSHDIASIFKMLPEDIFPKDIYNVLDNKSFVTINMDELELPCSTTKENDPIAQLEYNNLRDNINKALSAIPEREREAIIMHFGLNDSAPQTFAEIGGHFGVCSTRARQIIATGLRKLRYSEMSKFLKPFINLC